MTLRLVPWVDTEEWLRVREQVCSSDTADLQAGHTRLRVWHARGKLPIAVENTLHLLNAVLGERERR